MGPASHFLRAGIAGLILLSPAAALQSVWVVDQALGAGTDFSNLQAAVDAAAPGDVLLVRSGIYPPFFLDGKGLTIAADTGAGVWVSPAWTGYSAGARITDVPAGQTAILRGLHFDGSLAPATFTTVALRIEGCVGTVWVEDCVLASGSPSLRITDCAAVVLERSSFSGAWGYYDGIFMTGPQPGIEVFRSAVVMNGCEVSGGQGNSALALAYPGVFPAQAGAPALRLIDGALVAAGGLVSGGQGGSGISVPFCVDPAQGGAGLVLAGEGGTPPFARLSAVVLVGGAPGGPDPFCGAGASTGVPVQVDAGSLISEADVRPSLTVPSPQRSGSAFAASVTTPAGEGQWVVLAMGTAPGVLDLGWSLGVLLVAPPPTLWHLGPAAADGSISLPLVAPPLPPGLGSAGIVFQAVACVPNLCRAGSGSHLLLLP